MAELLGTLSPPPSSSSPPPSPPPCDDLQMNDMELDLPPLPVIADLLKDDMELKAENKEQMVEPSLIEVKCHGLRRRLPPECIVAAPIKLSDPFKPMDPHEQASPPRPVRAGRIRRPPPCSCHLVQEPRKRKKAVIIDTDKLTPIDEHILKNLPDIVNNNTKGSGLDVHPALRDEVWTPKCFIII